MKRLLFISSLETAPWGAAEELWYHAALEGHSKGIEVCASVKAWPQDPAPVANLAAYGIRVHRRLHLASDEHGARVSLPGCEQGESIVDDFQRDFTLLSQPDVLSGVAWMTALRRRNFPFAIVTHYLADFEWPNDEIVFDLADGYREARRVYFVSNASRRLAEKQIATNLYHSEVVRTLFQVPYHVNVPWPSANELRLACVARLDPIDKGQDLLLEVLAMPKWRLRPVRATLYGNGPFRRSLEAQIRFWKLNSVEFGPWEEQVVNIWRHNHALVLPSRAEGLPAVIPEAMLCGRVCLVTDIGGNAELLTEGRTGYVARWPSVEALDSAMECFWADRERLENVGAQAQLDALRLMPPNPGKVFLEKLLALF